MGLGALGKTVPIVGTSIIITLAGLTLSLLYFIFGFAVFTKIGFRKIFKKDSYANIKPWDIIICVFTGFAFQTLISALVFQIQHWPGTNVMSFIGLISSVPFILLAVILSITQNSFIYTRILKRGIPLVIILFILFVLPLTSKLEIFKVGDPETKALILDRAKEANSN